MKRVLLIMLLGMLVVAAAACGGSTDTGTNGEEEQQGQGNQSESATPEVPADFTFGAATVGGFWYTLAGAMGEEIQKIFPESSVTVVEGGSVANLLGLGDGSFVIAFSNGQTIPEALNGLKAFEEPIANFGTIATMYPNVMQFVVRADSDIYTIEDLKGKRVSPGIRGYSGEIAFQQILDIHGMSYDDLAAVEYVGTADAANLIRDGHIDAFAGMLVAPASTFQELDTTIGIRLISLEESTIQALGEINEGYLPYTVEAETYANFKEDAQTVASYTVLLASTDLLSEEAGYELTKMIFEQQERWATLSNDLKDFNAKYSVEHNIGPYHPGAEKYYRELGLIE
ncbi:TRAP transporter TAXI family solute receptor [Caldalkalibacillus uzonensis]|uniref:TRAP transporter TAXI family solute receptor n=1 Tax=Caldalkalibacillus uzonensis TaxID=353224 RepID=A0ABU0CWI6_9BACI|nr:TAXI family TRAP transporter solute-binding subunit [Caldalkalibacillus uzonensis]MDQ0340745.1 TRAP transporter TAXI family solute receptor [Caldalkalibacillus uzonensis]